MKKDTLLTCKRLGGYISYSSGEGGTVTGPQGFVQKGQTVSLTVTPDNIYKPNGLTVLDKDGNSITVTDNQFIMPDGDVTVTASFDQMGATVQVNGATGGSISASHTGFVPVGTTVTVMATPSTGYYLSSIKVGTLDITSSKSFTVTVDMDGTVLSVAAVFAKRSYTVSVVQATGGTITASPSGSVAYQTKVTVTATPNSGYSLSSLTYNGTSISNGGSFYMPAGNVTVTGSFASVYAGTYTVAQAISDSYLGHYGTIDNGTWVIFAWYSNGDIGWVLMNEAGDTLGNIASVTMNGVAYSDYMSFIKALVTIGESNTVSISNVVLS